LNAPATGLLFVNSIAVLLLAVALDLLLGDPPNRLHPVSWIGKLISLGRSWAEPLPREVLALYGLLLIVTVGVVTIMGALLAQGLTNLLWWPLTLGAQAWLLKCSFSIRGLVAAVWQVRDALAEGELAAARGAAGFHLVSRRTDDLDAGATAGAAVESLAENLTDSWTAPLCFYLVAGLPGAWLYRAVNTADAMIGYRQGLLEQLGGASARLDDVLNWIPARLGALALCAGAWLGGESARGAWRMMRKDGGLTASPNAGQTMAAMAGALGVTLEKLGHYRLGDGPPPDVAAMDRAVRVFAGAAGVWLCASLLFLKWLS
jgi:adenosylcobinamide-phosphate synthase